MAMNYDRNDQKNSEYNDKAVAIKRISKTAKGGRTICFSALVIVEDGKGKVDVGLGKASEAPEVIRKGKEATMKNIVTVTIGGSKSTPHDLTGEYGSVVVLMKRAPKGTGIVAGGPARAVVKLVGIQNTRTRSLGLNNRTNVMLAMPEGLRTIHSPEEIVKRRGKSVEDIPG